MLKKILVTLAVVTGLVLAMGAAYIKMQRDAATNEVALRKRVSEYWEAVRLNDQHTRYRMLIDYADGKLQPDELRQQMSPQMRLLSFTIGEIKLERDGTAEVEITPQFTMSNFDGKGFSMQSKEYWTYANGDWYRGLRKADSKTGPTPGVSK